MIWIAIIVPGVVVVYFFYLRPILRAMPLLKRFYEEADGFWATVWAFAGRSSTMIWALFLQLLSQMLQWIDPIANLLGDYELRSQISEALQANPVMLGRILMVISLITIAARLRGIMQQSEEQL